MANVVAMSRLPEEDEITYRTDQNSRKEQLNHPLKQVRAMIA